MRYATLCSGIEAPTAAWHALGWQPVFFSEIDPHACSVLAHHGPDVPNLGDMTKITEATLEQYRPIDLICAGTPCQSFSVAGKRGGMDDPRGQLALQFSRLVAAIRPKWLVWENVPGVLSSTSGEPACTPPDRVGVGPGERVVDDCEYDEGGDFAAFVASLVELGYGIAYRVLDAQYAGVPQRRRRVIFVGYLGDWRRAAAVLFERHSLSWNSPPSRAAREAVAALTSCGVGTCGADDNQGQAGHLIASTGDTSHCLNAGGEGHDASEDGTGRGVPLVAFTAEQEPKHTANVACTLGTYRGRRQNVATRSTVRRLTPRECERLQGFQDDYTLVPHCGKPMADGPRYRMLGNSMAVPVMAWIGRRIEMVEGVE